jgi:CysZ protein
MRRALPTNFIAQGVRGFTYPFEAFGFISRNGLWGLTAASIAVNVILLGALIWGGFHFAGPIIGDAEEWIRESLAEWLIPLFRFVAAILLLAASGVVLLLVGQLFASPFLDMLSERVESTVLGTQRYPFSIGRLFRAIIVAFSDLVWSLLYIVAANVPIWLLGFLLAPVSSVLSFLFNALVLAQEFVGLSLARQLVGFRRRWSLIWRNRWLTAGFGSATMLLLLVPGLNLVLLPLAAVGGTLLYCDMKASGRVDESALLR